MLALLDGSDSWHRLCVEVFRQLRLPLMTTETVLTELFHLVGDSRHETEAAWQLVNSGVIVLAPIDHPELKSVHTLMTRYSRSSHGLCGPATLVHLAKREQLTTIFTVDRANFETYRIDGRRRFRIIPSDRP